MKLAKSWTASPNTCENCTNTFKDSRADPYSRLNKERKEKKKRLV
jgi:hypothetical protein